jgi:hypothetical protein
MEEAMKRRPCLLACVASASLVVISCASPDLGAPDAVVVPRQPAQRRVDVPPSRTHQREVDIQRAANGRLELAPIAPSVRLPIAIELAETAADWTRLRDRRSRVELGFRLVDHDSEAGEPQGDVVDYAPAAGSRVHVAMRAQAHSVEDFVEIAERLAEPKLSYAVALTQVAMLRVGRNIIEYLDAAGHPRFRTGRPWVKDRTGQFRWASLTVSGCVSTLAAESAYQTKLELESSECRVEVKWDDAGLTYPLLIDPPWESAGLLIDGRAFHTATKLNDGKLLVTGGYGVDGKAIKTVEIYDPTERTWQYLPDMGTARASHTATLVSLDRLVVVGGYDTNKQPLATAEIYSMGVWGNEQVFPHTRAEHTATLLDDRIVIIGGGTTAVDIFDGTEPISPWSSGAPAPSELYGHTATALPGNTVLITGGSLLPFPYALWSAGVRTFDTDRDIWNEEEEMAAPRAGHSATLFADNNVLVTGASPGAEIFRRLKWQTVNGPSSTRQFHTAERLLAGEGQERVILAGGVIGNVTQKTATYYAAETDEWLPFPLTLAEARLGHTMSVLADGNLIVVGGRIGFGAALKPAEHASIVALGAACDQDSACFTGHCVDKVCCETACAGACDVCSSAKGSSEDGRCEPVAANVELECAAAESVCMKAAVCDGIAHECPDPRPHDDGVPCDDDDEITTDDRCRVGVCEGRVVLGGDGGTGGVPGAAGQAGAEPDAPGGGGSPPEPPTATVDPNPFSCASAVPVRGQDMARLAAWWGLLGLVWSRLRARQTRRGRGLR